MNGDLEEFFGVGDEGALTSVGHRVWYPHGELEVSGELVVAAVRAPV